MKNIYKTALVLSFALLILLGLGACGGSGGEKQNSASGADLMAQDTAEVPEAVAEEGFDGGAEAGSAGMPRPQDRKLITTVNIQAETKEYDSFMSWVEARTAQAGGYIESSDMYSYSEQERSCEMTLRIPADKLNGFLKEMGETCNIVQRSVKEDDVTLDYVDAESYRDALLVEQERLLELLKQAENLTDIMSIEDRLTTVRYQLQSYESTIRVYDNQINYSTVYLSIREVSELTEPVPESWGSRAIAGMRDNARDIARFFQELALLIVTHIPALLLVGAVVLVALLATAKYRRKAKAQRKAQKELIRSMSEQSTQVGPKPKE